uniref:Uncharacterized protein n=1 Tax=Leersia perrieri TaxID=77586 RepID=A0A0D9WUF1_9ORYZ
MLWIGMVNWCTGHEGGGVVILGLEMGEDVGVGSRVVAEPVVLVDAHVAVVDELPRHLLSQRQRRSGHGGEGRSRETKEAGGGGEGDEVEHGHLLLPSRPTNIISPTYDVGGGPTQACMSMTPSFPTPTRPSSSLASPPHRSIFESDGRRFRPPPPPPRPSRCQGPPLQSHRPTPKWES